MQGLMEVFFFLIVFFFFFLFLMSYLLVGKRPDWGVYGDEAFLLDTWLGLSGSHACDDN